MFLRDLTLKGFKSFAEPCTLEMEPGVTVVVGPNGSGKSNVVDAIAWVLGAQAPSAVRCQKMDDVIFAGTEGRAALGRAEVSLTIDNSARLLPIELEEVRITRTLFRSGDSEYALNDVPCRLLDIQELLSDAGVGRQQHVIVSQGQIDAVLAARPEDRRAVIEEAAGVLKHRRRKEKAMRRLTATEDNLTRLQDLLREVRRQLRPLERQAEAARRHGGLVAEVLQLRRHLTGRELAGLRERRRTLAQRRTETKAREGELQRTLAALDQQIMTAEDQLSARGEEDLGEELARMESLRQRVRGTLALLGERRRAVARERETSVDRDVVASLEADAQRLAEELAQVESAIGALTSERAMVETAEADLANQRDEFERQWGEGVATPTGHAAQLRGELGALRHALDSDRRELAGVQERIDALGPRREALEAEAGRLRSEIARHVEAEEPLVARVTELESERQRAEAELARAEETHRSAEREHQAWTARAEALSMALADVRAESGVEQLVGVDGVLGPLLELVDIDEGYEHAFEAAVGDAVSAVVMAGDAQARRAFEILRGDDVAAAVIALGPAASAPPPLPTGAPRLRDHVRSARVDINSLLDRLVGAAVVADSWGPAVDIALADPWAVVVTTRGDRFGPGGWRVGAPRAGATGAALDEARRHVDDAARSVTDAGRAVDAARAGLQRAEQAEAEAVGRLDDNDGALAAATGGLQQAENDLRDAGARAEALGQHHQELSSRVHRQEVRLVELEARLPELEAEEEELLDQGRRLGQARAALEETAASVGSRRADLEVRSASLAERRELLDSRLADITVRLEQHAAQRVELETRRTTLAAVAAVLDRLTEQVESRASGVEAHLADLRARRQKASDEVRAVAERLDRLRRERQTHEQELARVRETEQRIEIDEAEINVRLETLVQTIRTELDCEPDAAVQTPAPELPEGGTPAARLRELERELRVMGPINPLALEEYEALKERYEFVEGQLEDVRRSRREIQKLIRAIDDEIVSVFTAAYADVAEQFTKLFGGLFPGGSGKLILTDPDDMLESGIEVEARPSGKKVRKLSLLSGGERSLTALAFLFAVFRSRPSPFYVMDEVEAALDDVNLHRFLGLLREFRDEAQLVVVSHQKRTMEAADCLIGVSMKSGGSSRIVVEKTEGGGASNGAGASRHAAASFDQTAEAALPG